MENTLALQTIMVTMWMVVPQPGMGLLPHQQQAYLEQQQAQVHARQIDAEWGATQHHDELANEQATLDAQIIELHRRKTALGMGQAVAIDYTKAWADQESSWSPTTTKKALDDMNALISKPLVLASLEPGETLLLYVMATT
jgi:hypothetical protein